MSKSWRTFMVFALVALFLLSITKESFAQGGRSMNEHKPQEAKLASIDVSGPYRSGNLAVYLIHGQDAVPNMKMITLDEALAQKKVIVRETGSVNQLTVENVGDVIVFLQAGDIVKGGQQDRTLQNDLILKPKSGKVQIDAFCVESGRWSQRGSESRTSFGDSKNMLASKALKIAARKSKDQGEVWKEVSAIQGKLKAKSDAKRAGFVVAAPSPTSLQLTLESSGVKQLSQSYVQDLKGVNNGRNDTIGYAFAVNGKINSVDVYSSHDLFNRLWPKLMTATAQEAAADADEKQSAAPPSVSEVKNYIKDTETTGKETKENAPGRLVVVRRESPKSIYFQTRQQVSGKGDSWFHKNYLTK